MSAKETSKAVRVVKTVVVVLAATFAVFAAGCAAKHEAPTTFTPAPSGF